MKEPPEIRFVLRNATDKGKENLAEMKWWRGDEEQHA
jgi:hypothetical protein